MPSNTIVQLLANITVLGGWLADGHPCSIHHTAVIYWSVPQTQFCKSVHPTWIYGRPRSIRGIDNICAANDETQSVGEACRWTMCYILPLASELFSIEWPVIKYCGDSLLLEWNGANYKLDAFHFSLFHQRPESGRRLEHNYEFHKVRANIRPRPSRLAKSVQTAWPAISSPRKNMYITRIIISNNSNQQLIKYRTTEYFQFFKQLISLTNRYINSNINEIVTLFTTDWLRDDFEESWRRKRKDALTVKSKSALARFRESVTWVKSPLGWSFLLLPPAHKNMLGLCSTLMFNMPPVVEHRCHRIIRNAFRRLLRCSESCANPD